MRVKNLSEHLFEEAAAGYNVTRWCGISPNPNCQTINEGLNLVGKGKYDAVVAIGGGSVLDSAKLVRFFMGRNMSPEQYLSRGGQRGASEIEQPPLIAIPTTSGTGSEATQFAVLYHNRVKHSIDDASLLPDVVIIDEQLMASVPPSLAASAGADALCQAIESFWAVRATEESRAYAARAINLCGESLARNVLHSDRDSRLAMAEAAYYSGRAINISRTTAPHALSYPLTAHFGIPHGQAVAITVPAFFSFNEAVTKEQCQDERGVAYVVNCLQTLTSLLGARTAREASEYLVQLFRSIGLKTSLGGLGISQDDYFALVQKEGLTPSRAGNNPRRLSLAALRQLASRIA